MEELKSVKRWYFNMSLQDSAFLFILAMKYRYISSIILKIIWLMKK